MKDHLKRIKNLPIFWLLTGLLCLLAPQGYTQNSKVTFGKNRVQYKKFNWRVLSTTNFNVYYYDSGARMANFAVLFLEEQFGRITDLLGYTPYAKTKVFIYNSVTDLQQSNVGLDKEFVANGGKTNFFKAQVEVPYTGNESRFKRELKLGISQMFINEMMFGGSLKDMLQSSYIGSFPEWFLEGAAAYVAEGWSQEMDNYMRDLFTHRKRRNPNITSGQEAIYVGQSVWNFIAEKYSKTNISNILNLARIIRNEKNSISSSLGVRYRQFMRAWRNYYRDLANLAKEGTEQAPKDFSMRKRNPKKYLYNHVKLSPDGRFIAYSENRNGKFCVMVKDLTTKKRKIIYKGGYHAIYQRFDNNIPLMEWQDERRLAIVYAHKGETKLTVYDVLRKKRTFERVWFFFNHITSFDISRDGKHLVLSADRKKDLKIKAGQNDLYTFDLEKSILKKITDDWYDDMNPRFMGSSNTKILFSSNRVSDSLKRVTAQQTGNFDVNTENFDIFIYDPAVTKQALQRVTYTPDKEIEPVMLNRNTLLYLNDETGIFQLYKHNLSTGKVTQLTNYSQSIEAFDVNNFTKGLAFLMLRKGKYYVNYKSNFDFSQTPSQVYQTLRKDMLNKRYSNTNINKKTKFPVTNIPDNKPDTTKSVGYADDEVNTDDYRFDPDVIKEIQKKAGIIDRIVNNIKDTSSKKEKKVKVKGPYDYEPRFRTENVTSTVEIDPLRGWGVVLNISMSDMLENHKINGGLLFITDLRSSTFFGEYQYLGGRFDYKFRYEKANIFINQDPVSQRYTRNNLEATVAYPFTNLSRISVTPFYTVTQFTNLRPQASALAQPEVNVNYGGLRMEYVFDNTVSRGLNMLVGTRIKAKFENFFGVGAAPESFNKFTVEFRRYTQIHRDLIFATRISYGQFGGNSPKSFLLGGMDNWIFNQTDGGGANNPLAITTSEQNNSDLLFTEFVTNMRGFNYNKLSGTNYMLANFELRLPIVKYLFGKRITSNFFKNLQFIGFFDVGSAWTGPSPLNEENSLNTRNIGDPNSPFKAIVTDFKDPFISSYGMGVRTMLLGYYAKLDVAWGIENGIVAPKPKFYITFGNDF